MKKIFAVALVLLMSGFVLAQYNTSTTVVVGNGNQAYVDQLGSYNESLINQNTWGTGHYADIDQTGYKNKNDLLQDQRGAWSKVLQDGNENTSLLKQSGPNDANVYQKGNNNKLGSYYNITQKAFQKNGTSFSDDKNWLDLDQIGNNNQAGVWQEHHADALIYQKGNNNVSKVYQSGAPSGDINKATIKIYGNLNETDVYQFGDKNNALVELGVYGGANDNKVNFDQNGFNNYLETKQVSADFNEVNATQTGDNNFHRFGIKGDANKVNMTATGNGNRGSWSFSSTWPAYSDNNNLDIIQTGNTNYNTGQVAGDYNDIDIKQEGNNNRIGTSWYTNDGVNILGHLNNVDIEQLSNNNSSLNSITGNSNVVSITQN